MLHFKCSTSTYFHSFVLHIDLKSSERRTFKDKMKIEFSLDSPYNLTNYTSARVPFFSLIQKEFNE